LIIFIATSPLLSIFHATLLRHTLDDMIFRHTPLFFVAAADAHADTLIICCFRYFFAIDAFLFAADTAPRRQRLRAIISPCCYH